MRDYIYSLSEINALCKKAARGAGLTWGQAEEIGNASKQLAAYGINVLQHLPYLLNNDISKAENLVRTICHINDYSHLLKNNGIDYHDIAYPIFLLPALTNIVLPLQSAFKLEADGFNAYADCNGIYVDEGFIELQSAKKIHIKKHLHPYQLQPTSPKGIAVKSADWRGLYRLAEHYFAPATEESRKNAGE